MADYMVEGACLFCGQVQAVKCSEPLEGREADEWITKHCLCSKAMCAKKVEEVLGEGAVEMGFDPVEELTINLIKQIADAALKGVCGKTTVALPCGDTLTVAPRMYTDGNVGVSLKRRQKREIG